MDIGARYHLHFAARHLGKAKAAMRRGDCGVAGAILDSANGALGTVLGYMECKQAPPGFNVKAAAVEREYARMRRAWRRGCVR